MVFLQNYFWNFIAMKQIIFMLVCAVFPLAHLGGQELGDTIKETAKQESLVQKWRVGESFDYIFNEKEPSWVGDGPLKIVIWGDYQQKLTVELNREIQELINKNPLVFSYSFKHFPIDVQCNPSAEVFKEKTDGSCYLAKLVEAAGLLSGKSARLEIHSWLLKQGGSVDLTLAKQQVALILGVDEKIVDEAVGGGEALALVEQDLVLKNTVCGNSLPVVLIGSRQVSGWGDEGVSTQGLFYGVMEEAGFGKEQQNMIARALDGLESMSMDELLEAKQNTALQSGQVPQNLRPAFDYLLTKLEEKIVFLNDDEGVLIEEQLQSLQLTPQQLALANEFLVNFEGKKLSELTQIYGALQGAITAVPSEERPILEYVLQRLVVLIAELQSK